MMKDVRKEIKKDDVLLFDVIVHPHKDLRLRIYVTRDIYDNGDFSEMCNLDITIMEYRYEQEVPYSVTGSTFAGIQYNNSSVCESVMNSLLRKDGLVSALYVSEKIQKCIKKRTEVAFTHNGVDVLKHIYFNPFDEGTQLSLVFATNKFAYYLGESESMAVVDIADNQTVTDMEFFASQAMDESIALIKSGEETLLYGDYHCCEA